MRKESQTEFLEEKTKGNVRIRLHCFETTDGKRYGLELSAFNEMTAKYKLLFFRGGLTLRESEEMFEQTVAYVGEYDWDTEEFVPQKA